MIMPCMNSTSLGEAGGSLPVVDEGRVFVGCPGAPGCTITGGSGLVCWAPTDTVDKQMTKLANTGAVK